MSWLLLSLLDPLWDHSLTSILSNSSDHKLLKFLEYARLFLSGAPFSPLLPNTLLQDSAQMLPSPGSLALSHQPSPNSQIGLRVLSLSFRDMLSAVPSPEVICLTSVHGSHHPKTPPSSTNPPTTHAPPMHSLPCPDDELPEHCVHAHNECLKTVYWINEWISHRVKENMFSSKHTLFLFVM